MAWKVERVSPGATWDYQYTTPGAAEKRAKELTAQWGIDVQWRKVDTGSELNPSPRFECFTEKQVNVLPGEHSNLCRCETCVPVEAQGIL